MPASKPKALLFDLGGVVIDIDFDRAFRAWQSISRLSFEELKRAFKVDLQYERHERGEIAASVYFEHLASTLELKPDYTQIEAGWNAIFVGEIAETTSMVRAVRARFPCHVFSNTNAAHQAAWSRMFPTAVKSFDRVFASHEIGHRKPEQRAFEHVARAVGVSIDSIVFFDDLFENVKGATAAGLRAVHVRSPSDVRLALQTIGCSL